MMTVLPVPALPVTATMRRDTSQHAEIASSCLSSHTTGAGTLNNAFESSVGHGFSCPTEMWWQGNRATAPSDTVPSQIGVGGLVCGVRGAFVVRVTGTMPRR